ncbi:MAG: DUF58 domain-containing protein [Bacteroidales bacterium]
MGLKITEENLFRFGQIEFIARQVVEGFVTGLHKSPYHGFSVEFAEHRLYNPGESTRNIDWKVFGKTDKLFVKRFEEETNLRCQIVIDCSSSMYFPSINNPGIDNLNKIGFSVFSAASIMQLMKKQRDAVGLSLFSDKVTLSTPVKSSTSHHSFLTHELESLLNKKDKIQNINTSAAECLHQIAETIHKRSLILVFSDMFEDPSKQEQMFTALQHLKHNKHEVVLFHVTDVDRELKLNYPNRPYRFVDMESGEEIKLNPAEIRESYEASTNSFFKKLKEKCYQYKIDYVNADLKYGFDKVLLNYLLKRQKLY